MTARKTPAKPAKPLPTRMATKADLRPTPDVPPPVKTLTFADIGEWHKLKHAPTPQAVWDVSWLVVALMLLACLALGYIAGAFGPGVLA